MHIAAVTVLWVSAYAQAPKPSESVEQTLRVMIQQWGFNYAQITRLWHYESLRKDHAVGPNGEIGRGQLLLSTARMYDSAATKKKLRDPIYNTIITLAYLSDIRLELRKRGYHGRRLDLLMFTAYNRGHGTVYKELKRGKDPVRRYARRIVL